MGWSKSRLWPCVLLLAVAGCANNPMVLQGQVQKLQQEQLAANRQNQEIQNRAAALDRDNQEMSAVLAQAKQRNKVLEDQLAAVREQLTTVTGQLAQTREQKQATESKVQALNASLQRRGGATITPNNSYLQTLPTINYPDISVRRDGDVVRVELPGDRLFESNIARLQPAAVRLVADIGVELRRVYPEQIIGVEGHTDTDPINGGQYRNNHELSVARATVIYDVLVSQARIPQAQLFLVGHGPNHPVASNATPAGKQRNRRVELVIYPDKAVQ